MKRMFTIVCFVFSFTVVNAQASLVKENIKEFFKLIYTSDIEETELVERFFYDSSDSSKNFWSSFIAGYRVDSKENEVVNFKRFKEDVLSDNIEIIVFDEFNERDKSKFKNWDEIPRKGICKVMGKKGFHQLILMRENKISSLIILDKTGDLTF